MYQSDGIEGARCGSLARIGWPDAVWAPLTTQSLEPMPPAPVTVEPGPRPVRPPQPLESPMSPSRSACTALDSAAARIDGSSPGDTTPCAVGAPAPPEPGAPVGTMTGILDP